MAVEITRRTLQANVSTMTLRAVRNPHTSVSTSPSMYASGNVTVPASKSVTPNTLMSLTAMMFAVKYKVISRPEMTTRELKLSFRFFTGFSETWSIKNSFLNGVQYSKSQRYSTYHSHLSL